MTMNFGISLWSMGKNQIESLMRVSEAGFRYVEMWPEPWRTFEEDLNDLLDAINVYDVEVYSVHAPFSGLDISDIDEGIRRMSLQKVLRALEVAVRLGCTHFVVHPSARKYGKKEDYEKAKSLLMKSVEAIVKKAEDHGVTMSIENMLAPPDGFRVGTKVSELKEIIAALRGGEVGICLDTGHANYNGLEVAEEAKEAGDLLTALHVNDNDGRGDQHMVPGEGTIDWPKFIEALKDVNYNGVFMLEIYGGDRAEEKLRKSYEAASKLLSI